MAHLVQMRQRIKSIETIKKITHAMRLIAMANHGHLKNKEATLSTYTESLKKLFAIIKAQEPSWTHPILYPNPDLPEKPLVIVIGSQKGLCGGFNSQTLRLFNQEIPPSTRSSMEFIAIGKKIVTALKSSVQKPLVKAYPDFSTTHLLPIAHELMQEIFNESKQYTQVIIFSSKPRTFFLQKPHKMRLIPFTLEDTYFSHKQSTDEYIWEQTPHDILSVLTYQCIESTLQTILFQSLLAEQAARFHSMNSATKNAQELLDTTQLLYNKVRQTNITKELTELTGSF